MFSFKCSAYIQLYFERYTLKYKYWNEKLVLKHKIKNNTLKRQFKHDL